MMIVLAVIVGSCCYYLGIRKGKRVAWDDFATNYIVIHKSTIINNKKYKKEMKNESKSNHRSKKLS